MFKKTKKEIQSGLFCSAENFLSDKFKSFHKGAAAACHKVFLKEIPRRIEESILCKVYSSEMGAPNSSVRVLLAMRVVKKDDGECEKPHFEVSRYHSLIRCAFKVDSGFCL